MQWHNHETEQHTPGKVSINNHLDRVEEVIGREDLMDDDDDV